MHFLFLIFFIYLGLSVIFILIMALAARFFYKNERYGNGSLKKIAVLVPAYKEDYIIKSTAEYLLELDYPREWYDIYIIADSFQPETINQLTKLPIEVIEVSFEKSTKSKSLNVAFQKISKTYDIVFICDADNILANDTLRKIASGFTEDTAIQARRVAKNLDTSFAVLDACSEAINNTIFRKGANAFGLSASLIGSGMAFQYQVGKEIFDEIQAMGDVITHEDKIVQLKILERGIRIKYLNSALVFDEKVDSPAAFKQQRRRWVSGQFIYLKKFFVPACRQLAKGNISYFHIAVTNNLLLPRAYLLAMLPLLAISGFFLSASYGVAGVLLFAIYIAALMLALPPELVNRRLLHALGALPKAVFIMFGTLLHLRKANTTFIHTVHTKTEVSNTLFNDEIAGKSSN